MRTRLSFRKEFGGRLCGSAGAYATSKHAVEAFTDSLTQQVAGASVQVSLVEPGNYEAEISRNALKPLAKVDEMQALARAHPKTQ